MLNTRTWYLLTALALVLAAIEPSSANSRVKDRDYWTASKTSLEQANAHRRLNETQAACEALAKSLDYYRIALYKELPSEIARPVRRDEGDAMQEIRTSMQSG
jgi:hypothetical protein